MWQNCPLILPYTCICTRSSVLIRREASLSLPSPRWPHKESISSTKIMEGALWWAIWKRFETSFSLSPIHFETKSDEETLNKNNSLIPVNTSAYYSVRRCLPYKKKMLRISNTNFNTITKMKMSFAGCVSQHCRGG